MANFIGKAIKHPGIEKAKAKANGRSTHAQLEIDSHSSNPTVRGRGQLGLRFESGGDLHHGRAKPDHKAEHNDNGMIKAMHAHADKEHPVGG